MRGSSGWVRWLTRTAVLLALTLAVQSLGLPQWFTGPLVNAFLLLASLVSGIGSGVLVGLLTPWIALLRGILPPPLAPMVPFIMLGNALLVIIFSLVRRKKEVLWLSIVALVLAALGKYLLLSQAVRYLVEVPPRVAQAMQVPQLLTALGGGAIALSIERALKKALK
ncbi:ECF transporter S component [Thermatribacter velox]|uniref:ECF transporter S component n=1 Tax=Thermatribacter velox TaxID=3039681 RepID=A0ABZ2YEQ2_9BACT